MVCLFVDDILYQVQTVIKTLSGYMGRLKGISGCNILGDGDVALILDPETVLKCLPSNLAKPQSTKHNREAKHV
ncbi:MAG: chemotaxis protein CheW [Lentisphaeraceae bacterium]|nr:chemotaxis protein CheW [Lentisphaeraceae bacterium]